MNLARLRYILPLVILLSCYHHSFENPVDPDNQTGDTNQRTGVFKLAADNDSLALYDVLNDSIGDTCKLDIGAAVSSVGPDYAVRVYCVGGLKDTSCGGIRTGTGDTAPIAGYRDSIEYTATYSAGAGCHLVPSLPSQIWLVCRDDAHFCKIILDSFFVLPDSFSGYFSYTLNLEPNDMEF